MHTNYRAVHNICSTHIITVQTSLPSNQKQLHSSSCWNQCSPVPSTGAYIGCKHSLFCTHLPVLSMTYSCNLSLYCRTVNIFKTCLLWNTPGSITPLLCQVQLRLGLLLSLANQCYNNFLDWSSRSTILGNSVPHLLNHWPCQWSAHKYLAQRFHKLNTRHLIHSFINSTK